MSDLKSSSNYPSNCPYCKSTEIGDYRKCAGRGLRFDGKEMFWCKNCGKNFVDSEKVIARQEVKTTYKPAKATPTDRFYFNRKGEKVYY